MRTIEVNLYQFDELSDEAKDVAINWYRQGALDYEWWDSTYEDAARVGLKITGFDLGRAQECTGHFLTTAKDCADAIVREHGPDCETRKDAETFLAERSALSDKIFNDEAEEFEDLDAEFLKTILEDYRIILQREEEFLTSDEQCAESIRANEYEFTENGNRA